MAEFPALPLFTDAILADTAHLTDEEFGLYMRILILMWRSPGCKVPRDPAWLLRRFPNQLEMVMETLEEFCASDGNFWSQKRLAKEYHYLRKQSKKQSERAKSRWQKEKVPCQTDAASGNAPHPTPPHPIKDVVVGTVRAYVAVGKEIARLTGWDKSPNWFGDYSRVEAWLAAGWNPDIDIYPTVGRLMADRTEPPASMKYFERAIADAYATRNAPAPKGTPHARPAARETKTDRARAAIIKSSEALGIVGKQGSAEATGESGLSVFSGIETLRQGTGGIGEHKSAVPNGAGPVPDGKNSTGDGVLPSPQLGNASPSGHSDDN